METEAENQKPQAHWQSVAKNFFVDATVLLAIFTGLAYVFAYRMTNAYVGYFGAEEFPVSISIDDLVAAFSALTTTIILFYGAINLAPLMFNRKLILFVGNHVHILAILALFFLAYAWSGVTWFSVITFILAIAFFIAELGSLVKAVRNGKRVLEYWQSGVEAEVDAGSKLTDGILSARIGNGRYLAIFLLIFGVPLLGDFVGSMNAGRQVNFLETIIDSKNYVLVRREGESILLAAFENVNSKSESYTLLGEFILVDWTAQAKFEMKNMRLKGKWEKQSYSPHRKTFQEWVNENFGEPQPSHGH